MLWTGVSGITLYALPSHPIFYGVFPWMPYVGALEAYTGAIEAQPGAVEAQPGVEEAHYEALKGSPQSSGVSSWVPLRLPLYAVKLTLKP
jgi:hypothetical protein